MPTTRWGRAAAAVRSWWTGLERDWQSVVIGLVVVALIVTFGMRIPW